MSCFLKVTGYDVYFVKMSFKLLDVINASNGVWLCNIWLDLFEKSNLSDNVKMCNIWLVLSEKMNSSDNTNSCKMIFVFKLNWFLST